MCREDKTGNVFGMQGHRMKQMPRTSKRAIYQIYVTQSSRQRGITERPACQAD